MAGRQVAANAATAPPSSSAARIPPMIVFFFIRPSGFFWFLAQFQAGCGTLLVSAAQQPLLPGTPQAPGRSVGAGAGPRREDKSDGQGSSSAPAERAVPGREGAGWQDYPENP